MDSTYAAAASATGIGRGAGEHRAVGVPGLLEHGGADGVDAQAARQLDGGGADEGVDAAVDGRRDRAGRDRLLREDAGDQGERAAVGQVREAEADQLDLAEQLVPYPGQPLVGGQLGQRAVRRLAGRAGDGVHRADRGVEAGDGGRVGEVDDVLAGPRGGHDLVPVPQGGDDRRAQAAGRADDQHPHEAASRSRSSSTTDGSSLVKIGVGFSTVAPTVTGRDSHRGVSE